MITRPIGTFSQKIHCQAADRRAKEHRQRHHQRSATALDRACGDQPPDRWRQPTRGRGGHEHDDYSGIDPPAPETVTERRAGHEHTAKLKV